MNKSVIEDKIYTIKGVSELLSIPLQRVRRAIKDQELECYRFGGPTGKNFRVRISARAIEKWLDGTKQKGIAR
jgi:excisionase family DNA binding protein